jgi:tetratricopeptide (TPR) repeat protein
VRRTRPLSLQLGPAAARGLRVAVAFVTVIASASLAAADYRVNYRSAILAVDGQRWSEAVMYLNQALKENSTEGTENVLITGSREVPYLPLYYLGYAYYRMGDCARATGAWQLAKMSEAVMDYPQLVKTLNKGVDACDTRGGGPLDDTTTGTGAGGAMTSQRKAEIAKLMKQADGDLKAKRFKQARDRAGRARSMGADPATVDEFIRRVAAAEPAVSSTASGTGPEREALLAFFAGDYGRTEQLLAPLFESGTLTPRGHLYLACAYAASGMLRGRDAQARLQRARDVYKQALAKNAVFTADWKFISPRLRDALEARDPS